MLQSDSLDTVPAPAPTEPNNAVPCRDDVLVVEWRERALLLPLAGFNSWRRLVRISAASTGELIITSDSLTNKVIVEIVATRTTITCALVLKTKAIAELGTSIADMLANASESIDRIPDKFWELLAAPLEGDL